MTEPTTPPVGGAGVSSNPSIRLEALRLAVKAMEHAPHFPSERGGKHLNIHAAADEEALAALVIAERFRVFLEGGAS
jgi:hypothetical protein